MKNRKIAEVLKAYRKMNNLSVRDWKKSHLR